VRKRGSRSLLLLISTIPILLMVVQGQSAFGQASPKSPTVSASALDFKAQEIGTRTPLTVTVQNRASSVLRLTARTEKPDYTITWGCQPKDDTPKSACVLEINFSPVATGDRSGTLQIEYQADETGKNAKLTVTLTGKGVTPAIGISPARLRFPPQPVGTRSDPQTVLLTNNSPNELTIERAVASGDFRVEAPDFPQVLKSKGATAALVTFKPVRTGSASGALTILSGASRPRTVELSGRSAGCLGFSGTLCADLPLAVILCLLYWLVMVVVRWHRVALPTRELLKAQISSLLAELDNLKDAPKKLQGLLNEAKKLIDETKRTPGQRLADFLFWSRGQEMSGWGLVHEVEVQMALFLPPQRVRTWLESSEQRLRTINDTVSVTLANAIHQELASPSADDDRRKALLAEALVAIYDSKDSSYASLVSWQNKTSWLVGSGLLLIVVLTGVFCGKGVLFLVGAAGGLLSRMSRSLDRKDVPTDYGASWTYLFLSPVAGALGAWAGILLSEILQQANVLGLTFKATWQNPMDPKTLGIALVFGFSERLLDGVLDKLVGKTLGEQTKTAPPSQPPSAAPSGGGLTITTAKLDDATVGQPYTAKLTESDKLT
jgi:hypothetical protein